MLLFSCPIMSDSLQLHGLKHARLPCPSLSPGVCSDSCLWSPWYHPTISSSVIPLFSCPQSFPASRYFPMSQLFASGCQNIGVCLCVCVLVAQWCLTLCHPMDCSLPGSAVHGILQARILEWVAITFSRRSSQPRDQTWLSHIAGRFFTIWATREALNTSPSNE